MASQSSIDSSNSLVDQFSSLFGNSTSPPDVFDFLKSNADAPVIDVFEVVKFDLQHRHQSNEPLRVEEYLKRLPILDQDAELRSQIIVLDMQSTLESGQTELSTQINSYLSRFPDVKEVIKIATKSGYARSTEATKHFGSASIGAEDETIVRAPAEADDAEAEATVCVDASEMSQAWPQQQLLWNLQKRANPSTPNIDQSILSISECPLFQSLPKPISKRIDEKLDTLSFDAGARLMQQGDPGNSLMMIANGIVEVSATDENGEEHFIARAGRGEVMGEMALLTEEPRSANVVAISDVEVLVLSADTFHEVAHEFPSLSVVLTQLVAQRLGGIGRDVLAGKVLGGYRISRRLGRGGMAVVYEANEELSTERVALKMMSHRLVYDQKALQLFQREADIIEEFDHNNIVGMEGRFEAFHTYFIVMQFCDGLALEEVLKEHGTLSEDEFRKIFGQIASALSYAHERHVIHRDIKPANIMLNRNGAVKLMDFGLAKPVEDDDTTQREAVVGTIRYMAPEQLSGAKPSPKMDYFALGCTAYKLLTGAPLFAETTREGMRRRHAKGEVPSLGVLCPDLSSDTAEVFENVFRHEPDERTLALERLPHLPSTIY